MPKTTKPAKTADKKPTKEEPGKREAYRSQKLVLVNKENPRREGSAAHKMYELYKKSKTVGAYLDAGGDAGYLRSDIAKGNVKVS